MARKKRKRRWVKVSDPSFEPLREAVGKLATYGASEDTVAEYCEELFTLAGVQARVRNGTRPERAVLEEVDAGISRLMKPSQVLLDVVLKSDRRRETLTELRDRAGKTFRLTRPVSGETVRQKYEPMALDRLTLQLMNTGIARPQPDTPPE